MGGMVPGGGMSGGPLMSGMTSSMGPGMGMYSQGGMTSGAPGGTHLFTVLTPSFVDV
jgi:hypothetical protein